MSRSTRKKILILDDDALFARSLKRVLGEKYDVVTTAKVAEAQEALAKNPPDVILLDMMLKGGESGLDLLRHMGERTMEIAVIALTAVDRLENVVQAKRLGATNYLTKPAQFDELHLAIENALEQASIRQEVKHRRDLQAEANRERTILGSSAEIEQVRREIATVGPTDATVLINGETGTGKELVARGIHTASDRANGSFVAVNCGAIPGDLFEAEFFGYRKGAFTGAQASSSGKFRLAHRGTLLLDEIGELPLEAQVKFLRALEEQEFYPVGSTELVRVDTRIVASTHRDLYEMVEEGKFREDLFFRLNVFQITIPPLRERREDILVLAEFFIQELAKKFRKEKISGLSEGAQDLMREYRWKGNVRELRNVLERVVLMATDDGEITSDYLGMLLGRRGPAPTPSGHIQLPEGGLDLDAVEKSLLQQALDKAKGNKSKAARLLNMSNATFYYRADKYEL
jgi:DNA-binding NtrC family response regulator